MPRSLLLACALLCAASPAIAAQEALQAWIPDARRVGEGRLAVAFWDIYDATLYAPSGEWSLQKPFALSLRYMRDIDGHDIADRSVQEMRGQGFTDEIKLAAWNAQMKRIFPNVEDGTVLSAIFIPGSKTVFYHGNRRIGMVNDAEFTQWFAGIWLAESTSEPQLRRRLLGLS